MHIRNYDRTPIWRAFCLILLSILLLPATFTSADPVRSLRFVVFGDHRGDNKAWDTTTWDKYTDGGITKPAVIDVFKAIKAEQPDFAINVGDLVTKWTKQLVNTTPDALFSQELADWAALWKEHTDNLPIFPVRGNQEVSASVKVWRDFIAGMPGIGSLAPNGPKGEELLTYAFQTQNCLFIGVDEYSPPSDNDSHYISPQAMAWIADQLDPQYNKLQRSAHKFVWGHVPAFPVWDFKSKSGPFTVIKDGLASPYACFSYDYKEIDWMEQREIFWNLLGQRKAEYFCGHDHIYARGGAIDSKGRPVRQTTIGNGGAPPPLVLPSVVPDVYINGPFVEAYTGIALPTSPSDVGYQLENPRIQTESFPLFESGAAAPFGYGYIIVDVVGPVVTYTYKAESAVGAGFQVVDTWTVSSED